MPRRVVVSPGLVFSIAYDSQFAIGVFTHELPRIGALVWIAQDTFTEQPALGQAQAIREWRWPVLFPLRAAARRGIVTPIGQIDIPTALQSFPTMRGGGAKSGWVVCELRAGQLQPTAQPPDRWLPIYQVVNDTRLKEMLSSGWRPERDW